MDSLSATESLHALAYSHPSRTSATASVSCIAQQRTTASSSLLAPSSRLSLPTFSSSLSSSLPSYLASSPKKEGESMTTKSVSTGCAPSPYWRSKVKIVSIACLVLVSALLCASQLLSDDLTTVGSVDSRNVRRTDAVSRIRSWWASVVVLLPAAESTGTSGDLENISDESLHGSGTSNSPEADLWTPTMCSVWLLNPKFLEKMCGTASYVDLGTQSWPPPKNASGPGLQMRPIIESGRVLEGRSWCRTRCAVIARGNFSLRETKVRAPTSLSKLFTRLRADRVEEGTAKCRAGSTSAAAVNFWDSPITVHEFAMVGAHSAAAHTNAAARIEGGRTASQPLASVASNESANGEANLSAEPTITAAEQQQPQQEPQRSRQPPMLFHRDPAPRLVSKLCPEGLQYMDASEMAAVFHTYAWEGLDRATEAFGRGIVFSGDSIIRGLFLSTVAALRGMPEESVELQYIRDLVYIAYEDGDVFSPVEGGFRVEHCELLGHWFGYSKPFEAPVFVKKRNKLVPSKWGHTHCGVNLPATTARKPLFIIMFAFDRVPNYINNEDILRVRTDLFKFSRVRLRVGGYFYWLNDATQGDVNQMKYGVGPLNASLTSFVNRMEQYLADNPQMKFVWMTTPFSGMSPRVGPRIGHLPTRNAKIRRWLLSEGLTSTKDSSHTAALASSLSSYSDVSATSRSLSSALGDDGEGARQTNWADLEANVTHESSYDKSLGPEEADERGPQWEEGVRGESEDEDLARAEAMGVLNRTRANARFPVNLLSRWRSLNDEKAARMLRNRSIRGHRGNASLPSSSSRVVQQRVLLDMAGIADVGYHDVDLRPRRDRIHFNCAWSPRVQTLDIFGMWANPFNCADPFNQAVLQYLLALLLEIEL